MHRLSFSRLAIAMFATRLRSYRHKQKKRHHCQVIPLLSHGRHPSNLILLSPNERSGKTTTSACLIHSSISMSLLLLAIAPTHSPPNAPYTTALTFVPITNLRMLCLTALWNASATTSVLATTSHCATVPTPLVTAIFPTSLFPKAHPSRLALPSPSLAPRVVPLLHIFTSPSSINVSPSTLNYSWII